MGGGLYPPPIQFSSTRLGRVVFSLSASRSASTDAFSFGCSALITNQRQPSRIKQYEFIPFELAKSTPPAAAVPQTMSSLYLNCVRNCRITVYRRPISSIRFISVSLRQLLATILLVCKAK
jgi:hypothetical protein